jgi:mannose-1-phosphate guanylyltransferase
MKLEFSAGAWNLDDLSAQIAGLYGAIESRSIDYGVMEKAAQEAVIHADFSWSGTG